MIKNFKNKLYEKLKTNQTYVFQYVYYGDFDNAISIPFESSIIKEALDNIPSDINVEKFKYSLSNKIVTSARTIKGIPLEEFDKYREISTTTIEGLQGCLKSKAYIENMIATYIALDLYKAESVKSLSADYQIISFIFDDDDYEDTYKPIQAVKWTQIIPTKYSNENNIQN
jgi:hypothetical protein